MPRESAPERVRRLVQEAVDSRRFASVSAVMKAAGLSRSYLAERLNAARGDATAGIGSKPAIALAALLNLSVEELLGTARPAEPPLVDIYPNRAWAVQAARDLDLPEAAVQVVLRQDPGRDLHKMAWFHRIEAEAESLRPSSQTDR